MSSIDERIVELKFDNRQFEAGIKTTLKSLDGLKQSLKFDASVKSLDGLTKAASKVKMDIKTDGLKTTTKTTTTTTESIKRSLGQINQAGKNVKLNIDTRGFQDNAKIVNETASKLKENLNFSSVSTSLQNFDSRAFATNLSAGFKGALGHLSELEGAIGGVNFQPMISGLDRLNDRFGAMSVIAMAALATIGAKAATVGLEMGKSMLFENAMSGFQEYETNLNSIQTILANTQSKGSTIDDVNKALGELNEYSDQTIYNFAEMARSIGTFTTAGVDLETSVSSIKGLSNVAAMSGANAVQAASATEQLSRALSSGKVALQDWMSIETAGMASESFRESIMETARQHGVGIDDMIKKHGSFRNTLQEGWLSTDIMTETLQKFTGDLTDEQLKQQGYNKQQIKDIQTMAKTAKDAATKVKTFTQMVGTLKEAAGTGWADSSRLVLGDFEEARAMWTKANNTLGAMIGAQADRRNKMLQDWNDLGGREVMIEAVANAFKALMGVITPVTKAFREVFPPTTGKQLYAFTVMIRNFTKALIPGAATTSILYNSFKLLFGILKIGVTIVGGVLRVIGALFAAIFLGSDGVSYAGKSIGEFIGKLADAINESQVVVKFFDMLVAGATMLGTAIAGAMAFIAPFIGAGLGGLADGLKTVTGYTTAFAENGLTRVTEGFKNATSVIGAFASAAAEGAKGFIEGGFETALTRIRLRLESLKRLGGVFESLWSGIQDIWTRLEPLRTAIAEMFADIGKNLGDFFKDVNFNDVIDLVNMGLLGGLVLLFRNTFKRMLGMGDGLKEGLLEKLTESMDGVQEMLGALTGTLEAMQQNLQADTLMKIAIAIGVLTASVVVLSLIDSAKLTKALIGIGVMVLILTKAMEGLGEMTTGLGFLKMPFIAGSMILLAGAILVLSAAVKIMSSLSWEELLKGLLGVSVLLVGLTKAAEGLARNPANLIATGIGLIAVAAAIKILASAVKDMAELSFGDMVKGLVGVGAVLGALAIFTNLVKVNKGAVATGVGLILLATAMKIMASALGDFAAMDGGQLIQGIAVLGSVLFIISQFAKSTSGNTNIIQTAISLTILGAAMKIMASAIGDFGSMSWEELAKGLLSMAIALKAIQLSMSALPPNMLANAIGMVAVGAALHLIAGAIKTMGGFTWEEIGKGLVTLGSAMLILAAGLYVMTGALPGAAALIVAAGALAILTPVIKALADLSWEQLGHAMAGLAAVFVIFGLAGLLLAPVTPAILALGTAIAMFGLGLMSAGIGTLAFVTALLALAGASAIAGPVLIGLVTGMVALIPYILEQIGIGISALAGVLVENIPVFLDAAVALLMMLLEAVNTVTPPLLDTLWMLIMELVDLLVRAVPYLVDAGMQLLEGILQGIEDNIDDVVESALMIIANFLQGLADGLGAVITAGADLIIAYLDGLATEMPRIAEAGTRLILAFLQAIANESIAIADGAAKVVIQFVNDAATAIDQNAEAMRQAGGRLAGAIIDGMTGGMASRVWEVIRSAGNLGAEAIAAAQRALNINSPSKEFRSLGESTGEGLADGIFNNTSMVVKAAGKLGQDAIDGTKKALDINSPSKEFEKLGKFTKDGFVKGLKGGSRDSVKEAYSDMKAMLKDVREAAKKDIQQQEERLKRLTKAKKQDAAAIAKVRKELAQSRMEYAKSSEAYEKFTKKMTAQREKLYGFARDYEKVTAKLEKANEKLEAAIQKRDDYKASIYDQFFDYADIDDRTNLSDYMRNLDTQIDKTKEFNSKMNKLADLGLSDALYKELMSQGVEALPFIDQLLVGGPDEEKARVKKLNGLSKELSQSAKELGYDAAKELYQAGVNSAKGLVDGLKKQEKAIKKQMDKIADWMIKAIKKALGIKSPSREFKKVGAFSGQGLIKGLKDTAVMVAKASEGVGDTALDALKKSMTGAHLAALNADLDMVPSIRPVLDLSAIKKDSGLIGGMLKAPTLSVDGSYTKAAILSAASRTQQEVATESGETGTLTMTKSYTYNQYISSPKEVSRAEIYRNTKNLISSAKGAK